MSLVSLAVALRNLQSDEIAWKLLRATNAPVIIAVLDEHLGGEERRLPVQELVHRVGTDLEELNFRADFKMGQPAQEYCEKWRKDGYLIRRPLAQSRQETYELSSGALAAISFSKRLIQPYRTVTQSRLNTIINQINNLAVATDVDIEHRRAALLEERERIDEQLAGLDAGLIDVLEEEQAIEQAYEILSLAQEIPDDFVSVRNDFELINKSLHATLINREDGFRDILDDIFAGVDQISQSPSGRSFKGFYSLLRDTDLTETLRDNIDLILDSDYSREISQEKRRFLREFLNTLLTQSLEVNTSISSFARGLRRFVQSQEYLRERVVKQQIDQALAKAQRISECYAGNKLIGDPLYLTSVQIMPISRRKLHNPSESRAASLEEISLDVSTPLTLAELREMAREIEIDFAELVGNINRAMLDSASSPNSCVSLGQVLDICPATQGVASIVGLMMLAIEQGKSGEGAETVYWETKTGASHRATIALFEFYREVYL